MSAEITRAETLQNSTFHLVPDTHVGAPPQDGVPLAEAALPPMWAVEGLAALAEGPDAGLALVPIEDAEGEPPSPDTPGRDDHSYVFEPLSSGARPRLMMLAADDARRARVNGCAAPRLSVLSAGDEVVLSGGLLLHVVLYHPAAVMRTPAALVGTECPLCRVRLASGDEVYVCRQCGSGVHRASEPATPGGPVLECVLALHACPVCEHPVRLDAGFSHEPWA